MNMYFPELNKTVREIAEHVTVDMESLEPTDSQGRCVEGIAEYNGRSFCFYSGESNVTSSIEEDAAIDIGQQLTQEIRTSRMHRIRDDH